MAQFKYRIRSASGAVEDGQIESSSTAEALAELKKHGGIVLDLQPQGAKHGWRRQKGVPLREKIIFTRQLAIMNHAGLSVVKALEALMNQTENKQFKTVISEVIDSVKGGQTISKAMARHPKVFSDVYVAVVKAGEQTGQLTEVLMKLSEQLDKEAELISRVKGALIYPAVIFVALIGVIFLIVFFVLPSLQGIFSEYGGKLPITTRLLFGSSVFLRKYIFVLLFLLVGSIFGLRWWARQPSGRAVYDHYRLKLPIFGPLVNKLYMARFSRTMSTLTKASLPIIEALSIVRKTINNLDYDVALSAVSEQVRNGRSLSKALAMHPVFSPMVIQLISLGEESGGVENSFNEIAAFYEAEVDHTTANLTTLVEPVMLIVIGIGVGFVVVSVIAPIYNLVNQIN